MQSHNSALHDAWRYTMTHRAARAAACFGAFIVLTSTMSNLVVLAVRVAGLLLLFLAYREYASPKNRALRENPFVAIGDDFRTFEELQAGLRKAGLESSSLMVGIDFTKSNEWNGARSNGGKSLHHFPASGKANAYEKPLEAVARTLSVFDDDGLVPVYGFGDATTRNHSVFSFHEGDRPCEGLEGVVQRYREVAPSVRLLGPTSFAPLIYKALEHVAGGEYHILVILADGAVTDVEETAAAIVEASHYALSIVMIGVGDGPFDTMEEFDDQLPSRAFDNFQFVDYGRAMRSGVREATSADVAFSLAALQEVPGQYQAIKRLGLLGRTSRRSRRSVPVLAPPAGPM